MNEVKYCKRATMNKQLLQFVRNSTTEFDSSHDVNHAIAVYQNAILIAKKELPDYDDEILQYACLLHDVCDHKYASAISKTTLHDYIKKQLSHEKAQLVVDIIENISFSKEVKGQRRNLNTPYQDIVSDADKLEALGEVGLERCITFTKEKGGRVPDDVVQHCHDKLLKLKDLYIKTKTGKALTEPLHNVIENYVLTHNYKKLLFFSVC